MQRTKILDEYSLPIIAHTLSDPIYLCETPEFSIHAFYLPLRDPENPPEKGAFGGDAFSIERLDDGRTFVLFRNGVDHGRIGRTAIKQGNTVLEQLLSNQIPEQDIAAKIDGQDLFERLDLFAYCLNELINRRYQNPAVTASSTLIAGTDKNKTFRYVAMGDSAIIVAGTDEIKNANHIIERKPPIGSLSVSRFFKKDERFYQMQTINLERGNKIIIASDGVHQLQDNNGSVYGLDPLVKFVSVHAAKSGETLLQSINDELNHFSAGAPLIDDYTLLVLERKQ